MHKSVINNKLFISLMAIGSLCCLVAALILVKRPPEPTYKARSLSHWLGVLDSKPSDQDKLVAEDAVRHIGQEAVPILIADLSTAPGLSSFFLNGARRRREAVRGFLVLGKAGQSGIPSLERLVERGHYPMDAARSLLFIGTTGVQSLIRLTQDPNPVARNCAVAVLGDATAEPELVLAAILRCESDSDPQVRAQAMQSLSRLRPRN